MPNTFWLKNNKLIVDASGHPIRCDHCPCGWVIPAGSMIELSIARSISRVKDVEQWTKVTKDQETDFGSHHQINLFYTLVTTACYVTAYDMAMRNGTGIPLLNATTGTVSTAFSSLIGTAHSVVVEGYISHPTTKTGDFGASDRGSYVTAPAPTAYAGLVDSELVWAQYGGIPSGQQAMRGQMEISWQHTGGTYANLPDLTPLIQNGYWAEGEYTESVTHGTWQGSSTPSYCRYLPEVAVEHISREEGEATGHFHREVLGTYDFPDEMLGYNRVHGAGVDTMDDQWTAHWLITYPDGAASCNCGL